MSGRRIKTGRVLIALAVLALGCFGYLRFSPVPGLDRFLNSPYSLPVYSARGTLLAVLPLENGLRRELIQPESLSREQLSIILDSEDKRFYFHPGVDPVAMIRAVFLYLKEGEIESGGSTITMQLARMISPRSRGMKGKAEEMINALRLETRLSKKKILGLYLSHLPFGRNVEGLESAAYYYLGKRASSLTDEELVLLMMIPRRPEDYNPGENRDASLDAVKRTMPRLRAVIAGEGLDAAYKLAASHTPVWPSRAPHFVEMIRQSLTEADFRAGSPVMTSLDDDFQAAAGRNLREIVSSASKNRIGNGAVLAIENTTGRILAYQGSVDFYDDAHQGQIDGVRILRQPGSTLKPFLYACALEKGFTPSTVLPDIPLEFGHREIYIPENYNERYNGPVRLSVALGSSLNVPAVYLAERLGVQTIRDRLLEAGFGSLEPQGELGVGIVLGNGEVSLLELVQGFSIFSRGGSFLPLTWRENAPAVEGERIFSVPVTESIRSILSNRENRILGFGRTSPLDVSFEGIFKTGTSNQFNNIWALGSTQDITVGVWMGNFSGETVIGTPGSSMPARLVTVLLEEFLKDPELDWKISFKTESICSLSGMKAGPSCTYTIRERYIAGTELPVCTWHRNGGIYLPAEYAYWVSSHKVDYRIDDSYTPLEIVQPSDGAVFFVDPTLPAESQVLPVRINGSREFSLIINGITVETGKAPLTYYHPLEKGRYRIEAVSGNSRAFATVLVK